MSKSGPLCYNGPVSTLCCAKIRKAEGGRLEPAANQNDPTEIERHRSVKFLQFLENFSGGIHTGELPSPRGQGPATSGEFRMQSAEFTAARQTGLRKASARRDQPTWDAQDSAMYEKCEKSIFVVFQLELAADQSVPTKKREGHFSDFSKNFRGYTGGVESGGF
jgi:hypothetical protein